MFNLRTVVKFEIFKQIRKPLFWLAVFATPALVILFGGVSYLGTKLSHEQTAKNKQQVTATNQKILVVDHTKLLKTSLFGPQTTVEMSDNADQALAKFKSGDYKATLIYPARPDKEPIKTYTKFSNNQSQSQKQSDGFKELAKIALKKSITQDIEPIKAQILSASTIQTQASILDATGELYEPFKKAVVPGIFLGVFFIVFTMIGNQILTATTEEKENRVAEMILTTVSAKTLIIGKIIALIILGFIQILSLILPLIIAYVVATNYFAMPPFIAQFLSDISFEFWPIFFGISYLIVGFLLVTSSTILVGSLFPTAQDAAQFYMPVVFGTLIPMYLMSAILSGVNNLLITTLSYFPLSSPTTMLIRNMAGNLDIKEGLLALTIMVIFSGVMMHLAVRSFQRGAFEYSKKGSFKQILRELLS